MHAFVIQCDGNYSNRAFVRDVPQRHRIKSLLKESCNGKFVSLQLVELAHNCVYNQHRD